MPAGDCTMFLLSALGVIKPKPMLLSLSSRDVDDSLLVLLHNLNGILKSTSLWKLLTAFGVGVESTCRVPEISINKPVMWGRPWWPLSIVERNLQVCDHGLASRVCHGMSRSKRDKLQPSCPSSDTHDCTWSGLIPVVRIAHMVPGPWYLAPAFVYYAAPIWCGKFSILCILIPWLLSWVHNDFCWETLLVLLLYRLWIWMVIHKWRLQFSDACIHTCS